MAGETVAVLGGGIAGLTAAHELAGRGYAVTIHEMRGGGVRGLGGKARSQYFRVGGKEVPGEHGYRFLPAFYRCLPDTMWRIPLGPGVGDDFRAPQPNSVGASLGGLSHFAVARDNMPLGIIHRNVPEIRDLPSLAQTLAKLFHSISPVDMRHMGGKLLRYYATGPLQRADVFEKISFWDYMEAHRLRPIARRLLENMPQSLVAMRASEGNARTLLDVLLLMMIDFGRPGPSEWVLPGPTTDTLIAPWARHLERLGVRFAQGPSERIVGLAIDGRHVTRAYRAGGPPIEADAFVLATPLEGTQAILRASDDAVAGCEELEKALAIPSSATRWMVGMQLVLRRDRPWVRGHIAFADSPWGLTAVSQRQLWSEEHRARLAAAGAGGIVSLIATEWEKPRGSEAPSARDLTEPAIITEVLRQVARCRDGDEEPMIRRADVIAHHIDDDVRFDPIPVDNGSPLLIHPPGLWSQRPQVFTAYDNLALAGDYVQNPMDLATMEGAN
ncbi:MAG: NAD(P)-binding protein, partial [Myxococcales bacterium]|nr:NAD(P)-binding protein [Myxococcales bacterium]